MKAFGARELGSRAAWLLIASVAAAAVALLIGYVAPLPAFDPSIQLSAWAFAAAFAVVEVAATALHARRHSVRVSLADAPIVVGLFFVDPVALVAAQLLGSAAGILVYRRPPVTGLAFRLALLGLTTCLTILLFRAAVTLVPATLPWRLAAYAATAVSALVLALGYAAFDGVRGAARRRSDLQADLVVGGLVALLGTSIGLMLVVTIRGAFEWLLLLVAPAVVAVLGYRAFVVLREREARLAFLHDCSRVLERPLVDGETLSELLSLMRGAFGADVAEILLSPAEATGSWTRTALGAGASSEVLQPVGRGMVDQRLALVEGGSGGGSLATRPRGGRRVPRQSIGEGLDDAVIVPLAADDGVAGTLMVANRLDRYDTFDRADLHLLEALGGHVGAAFRGARLIDRLSASLADASRLAAIVQSSEDAIMALAPDRTITSWNDGAARLFGYSAGEAVGRNATMLVPPDRRDEVARRLAEQPEVGPPRRLTTELLRSDGSRVPVATTISPITDPSGAVAGLSAIVRDETERSRAEAALRESEERAHETEARLRRAIAAFTAVREPAGVLRAVLAAARDLLDADFAAIGIPGEKGQPFAQMLADGISESAAAQIGQLPTGRGVLGLVDAQTGPMRFPDAGSHPAAVGFPASHPQIVSLLAVPIIFEGRLVARLYAGNKRTAPVFSDEDEEVSAALAAQAAVALANANAHARATEILWELDRANAELRRVSEAKSEFLATMSHELRTPLHSILVAAELIGDPVFGSLSDERIRELAGTIHASGRHLLQLVDDLVDLSKIEAARLELHPVEISVSHLLAEVRVEMAPLAREKGVAFELPLEPGPRIVADPLRLRQVMVNLVANAIKFTPRGGRVWVEVGATGTIARISVLDNGIGIAAEDLVRVFLPFEQASEASARGVGLGLAIAKRIVELHGGRLDATSTPGAGSTFTVTLPRGVPAGKAPTPAEPDVPPESLAAPGQTSVLIVEDDPDAMGLVADLLSAAGYDVQQAASLGEARGALDALTPGLVLLDLRLADGDGLDLARHMRAMDATRSVPILALSAEAMPDDAHRALDAGCDGYLTKPISPRDLLARIRDALAGDASAAGRTDTAVDTVSER